MDADLQDSPDESPRIGAEDCRGGVRLDQRLEKEAPRPHHQNRADQSCTTGRPAGSVGFTCTISIADSRLTAGRLSRPLRSMVKCTGTFLCWPSRPAFPASVSRWCSTKPGSTAPPSLALERFVNGFLDLLTISFLGRFGHKPMHLFGVLGYFDVCRRLCTFCRHRRLQIVGAVFSISRQRTLPTSAPSTLPCAAW